MANTTVFIIIACWFVPSALWAAAMTYVHWDEIVRDEDEREFANDNYRIENMARH